MKGRVLKIPPLPGPLPQFFASILPSNNTLSLRKKSRERGQLGDVQLRTKNQEPRTTLPTDRVHRAIGLNEASRVDLVAFFLGGNTAQHCLSDQFVGGI